MKLFGVSLSPYYERNMILLSLKGAVDKVEAGGVPEGGIRSPAHLAVNPLGHIPYLETDDGAILPEGQIIAEYLDAKFDGPAMVSDDPDKAAHEKLIARIVDVHVFRALWPLLMATAWGRIDEKAVEESKVSLPIALDSLDHFMSDSLRASGDDWSVADCAMIPLMFSANLCCDKYGISVLGDRPKLNAWWNNAKDSDVVVESHARMQASLEAIMAMMAKQAKA